MVSLLHPIKDEVLAHFIPHSLLSIRILWKLSQKKTFQNESKQRVDINYIFFRSYVINFQMKIFVIVGNMAVIPSQFYVVKVEPGFESFI